MSDDFSKKPEFDEQAEHRSDEEALNDTTDGELLGDLLDEITEPDESAEIEPVIAPVDEDAVEIEEKPYTSDDGPEEEQKSSILLIGIIVAVLVGGIAYFTTKSDSPEQQPAVTASNQTASPAATAQHKPATPDTKKALSTAKKEMKKEVEKTVASSKKAAVAEKPLALKPLLSEPAAVDAAEKAASAVSTAPSDMAATSVDTAALSSAVAVTLEVDPVTRKVISPTEGRTTFAWAVNLISLSTHAAADRLITKLKANGTETELVQINIGESTFYRVRVPNFSSVEEADTAHAKFNEDPMYKGSWVSRYRK